MIHENALDAFTAGEDALRQGQYEQALIHYIRVIRGVPDHLRARFRVADVCLNLKAPEYSFAIYKALALHAVKAGYPLLGLVAIKMAAAMDRAQGELVHVVAELYSKDSKRVDPNKEPQPPKKLRKTDPIGEPTFATGRPLVEEAGSEAADTESIEQYPDKLPPLPLFSLLDAEAFGGVMEVARLRRYVKDQAIIEEGKQGDSFFMLAEGEVNVTRNQAGKVLNLAKLHPGSVIGEMALIKNAPRAATVRAAEDCDLLELSKPVLEKEATRLASLTKALHAFTSQRLLLNVAATSAIFKPVPRNVRSEIISRFEEKQVPPGFPLIKEGEEGKGLFLIIKGEVDVSKKDASGTDKLLASLKEGEIFGEISLINSQPTTASCKAKVPSQVLFLPRQTFNSVMARYPELKAELSKVTADRIQKTKDALNPASADFELIEDDDVIML
jgi:CRP-like cAMP-binding protein